VTICISKWVGKVNSKTNNLNSVGYRHELHSFWWLYLPILFFLPALCRCSFYQRCERSGIMVSA